MSYDFTPVSERQRLQTLGRQAPHLLGQEYTWLEYVRRPTRRDIGSRMLYRDAHMTGWAYKIIQESDLKFPMVMARARGPGYWQPLGSPGALETTICAPSLRLGPSSSSPSSRHSPRSGSWTWRRRRCRGGRVGA